MIFMDIDGVLIDSKPYVVHWYEEAWVELFCKPCPPGLFSRIWGKSWNEAVVHLTTIIPIVDAASWGRLKSLKDQKARTHIWTVNPLAMAIIGHGERRVRFVTCGSRENTEKKLNDVGLAHMRFDCVAKKNYSIFWQHHIATYAPDSTISECIVIDDSNDVIQAAASAGCRTILWNQFP